MIEDRKFPLLGGVSRIGSVPWWVAEQAYMGYASKYGDSQSLERLAERGGFGIEEMDEFFPEWRDKVSLIHRLQNENKWLVGEIEWLCVEILRIQQNGVTLFETKDRLKQLLAKVSKATLP